MCVCERRIWVALEIRGGHGVIKGSCNDESGSAMTIFYLLCLRISNNNNSKISLWTWTISWRISTPPRLTNSLKEPPQLAEEEQEEEETRLSMRFGKRSSSTPPRPTPTITTEEISSNNGNNTAEEMTLEDFLTKAGGWESVRTEERQRECETEWQWERSRVFFLRVEFG